MEKNQILVDVEATDEEVTVRVGDRRPGSVTLFGDLAHEQRRDLAGDAWAVGLRAIANAYAQAEEARLQDIGKTLVDDIDRQLKNHIASQQQTISSVLARFFDPKDGQVVQRLAAFVDDQGVLAHLLDSYLAPGSSVLAETLARQVGESSPLFKKLSATDSDGLVKVLEGQLRKVMDQSHAALVKALDPLAEDGAVARFLRSLREELKGADEDRAKQLGAALNALDANDQDSLINRLMRETHSARQVVLQAVNPDLPNSPMAAMKQTLTTLLKEHSRSHAEALKVQQERQERLERDIRDVLVRLEARRNEEQRSPRGGLAFEDAVVDFVGAAVRGAPCIVEATGNLAGLRSRCKKGDLVVRFTAESAFDGAGVVFEAKRDGSYTAQRALVELDAARANREACVGVFVLAVSHAPDGFPRFARHGRNVLVVWDDSDDATDAYLHAAILLGLGLATRAKRATDHGDIEALGDIEGRIAEEVGRLEKMEKHNETIRKNSDGIADEIRKGRRQLDLLLDKAQKTLAALNVELHEEEPERASPIALPPGSCAAGVLAIEQARARGREQVSAAGGMSEFDAPATDPDVEVARMEATQC